MALTPGANPLQTSARHPYSKENEHECITAQHRRSGRSHHLREIQSALRDLRFGAVEITVHNAQVVQIERKEKFRLQQPGNKAG
jgi:hypothetical protein